MGRSVRARDQVALLQRPQGECSNQPQPGVKTRRPYIYIYIYMLAARTRTAHFMFVEVLVWEASSRHGFRPCSLGGGMLRWACLRCVRGCRNVGSVHKKNLFVGVPINDSTHRFFLWAYPTGLLGGRGGREAILIFSNFNSF